MLRAELLRPGHVELREAPVPEPGPGEIVVRIEAALTCGTDIKTFLRGHPKLPLPSPFGHEFSGLVARTGDGVDNFREGDAIACVPTAPCGQCRLCRRGRDNLCPDAVGRIVLGAFAEHVKLPAHVVQCHVFHRPAGLPAEQAAALEPLACVVHGAGRVSLADAERVVLLGDGPIALMFAQVVRLRGAASVLIAGRHENRLRVAGGLGFETTRLAGTDLRDEIRQDGNGADVVIECVGRKESWEAAQDLAAPGGQVLLYGGCPAGTRVDVDAFRLHYEEVDLRGAFHYGRGAVRDAFDLLREGRVAIEPLITHRRRLESLPDALDLVIRREAIKVAVIP